MSRRILPKTRTGVLLMPMQILGLNDIMRYWLTGRLLKTDLSKQFPPLAPVSTIPSIAVLPINTSILHLRAFRFDRAFLDLAGAAPGLAATAFKNPGAHTSSCLEIHRIPRRMTMPPNRLHTCPDSTTHRMRVRQSFAAVADALR